MSARVFIKDLKDLKRHLLPMEIAGDRPPRYGKGKHRDREVSPTGARRPVTTTLSEL